MICFIDQYYINGEYHARNIVNPVYFQTAIESLPPDILIIEIGPSQGLLSQIKRIRQDIGLFGLIKPHDMKTEYQCATDLPALLWKHGYNKHLIHHIQSLNNNKKKKKGLLLGEHDFQSYRLPLPQRHPMLWNHSREQKVLVLEDFLQAASTSITTNGTSIRCLCNMK